MLTNVFSGKIVVPNLSMMLGNIVVEQSSHVMLVAKGVGHLDAVSLKLFQYWKYALHRVTMERTKTCKMNQPKLQDLKLDKFRNLEHHTASLSTKWVSNKSFQLS